LSGSGKEEWRYCLILSIRGPWALCLDHFKINPVGHLHSETLLLPAPFALADNVSGSRNRLTRVTISFVTMLRLLADHYAILLNIEQVAFTTGRKPKRLRDWLIA
jgi:hypothetical protein